MDINIDRDRDKDRDRDRDGDKDRIHGCVSNVTHNMHLVNMLHR